MKSLVEDALSRDPVGAANETIPGNSQDAMVDAELEQILRALRTNIKIVGVGGGGCNTIARIVDEGVVGAELFAANTDAQHLLVVHAPHKLLLGRRITRGLGAGALPQVGEEATREAEDDIKKALSDAHICFVTCGLGGGTGTGGSPVIARIAKEMGALTVAIATLPFRGEGKMRMENAEWGLERLRESADTVILIPNDRLLEIVPKLSLNAAFKVADDVLMRSIKGLTEMITRPGLVNLDFNDLKTIMKGSGVAMMGFGESDEDADDRALDAIDKAINSPLLEVDVSEATGVLVDVIGGSDMTLGEAERAVEEVQSKVGQNARIIWGAAIDPSVTKKIKVMIVVTGVKSKQILGKDHTPKRSGELEFVR
ncbi:MAG: cell division protein FtsZ [Thermoplasmata archaeon]|nr:cell division protein FtsZ [Thermoplasmata archaeon]